MISLELYAILLIISGLLFAAHLLHVGSDMWFDLVFGYLSTIFMVVLTVLFAAGRVGLFAAGKLTALNDNAVTLLMAILCLTMTAFVLYNTGHALLDTVRGGY